MREQKRNQLMGFSFTCSSEMTGAAMDALARAGIPPTSVAMEMFVKKSVGEEPVSTTFFAGFCSPIQASRMKKALMQQEVVTPSSRDAITTKPARTIFARHVVSQKPSKN